MLKMDDRFVPFEEWEAERLQDPEFVVALAAREPAYQVARLRILRGLTQRPVSYTHLTLPTSDLV